jgi:hypothetical protein
MKMVALRDLRRRLFNRQRYRVIHMMHAAALGNLTQSLPLSAEIVSEQSGLAEDEKKGQA